MTFERELIERVVSDVMRALASPAESDHLQPIAARSPGIQPPAAVSGIRAGSASKEQSVQPVGSTTNEFTLTDNVLTEETLAERIGSHQQVVFGTKTVLTPSARDFLRRRNISWRRGEVTNGASGIGESWLAIVLSHSSVVEAAIHQLQSTGGHRWKRELVGSPQEAAERSVSAVCRGEATGVVVFAQQAAAIACRCNRNHNVRAATAADGGEVEVLSQQFGANVICVVPDGKNTFQLKNLARAFAAANRPRGSADWIDA